MDESKKRTTMLRARREFLEKRFLVIAFIKVMKILKDWCFFESLFSKINIDEKGTGEESTLGRRRPNISEGEILLRKLMKVGLERSKL